RPRRYSGPGKNLAAPLPQPAHGPGGGLCQKLSGAGRQYPPPGRLKTHQPSCTAEIKREGSILVAPTLASANSYSARSPERSRGRSAKLNRRVSAIWLGEMFCIDLKTFSTRPGS